MHVYIVYIYTYVHACIDVHSMQMQTHSHFLLALSLTCGLSFTRDRHVMCMWHTACMHVHAPTLFSCAQVTILEQRGVAAFSDGLGRLAAASPYHVMTKPHGHGDVHQCMHQSGLAARWAREGVRWIFFCQDSSALYFAHYLASLGVASTRQHDVCPQP